MGQARDQFRALVAETLTDWRLGRASRPVDFSGADEAVRAGIAEVLTLRLVAAYNPIFRTLQRIENQLAILASAREDAYAPPTERRGEVAQVRPPEYWRRQPH